MSPGRLWDTAKGVQRADGHQHQVGLPIALEGGDVGGYSSDQGLKPQAIVGDPTQDCSWPTLEQPHDIHGEIQRDLLQEEQSSLGVRFGSPGQ